MKLKRYTLGLCSALFILGLHAQPILTAPNNGESEVSVRPVYTWIPQTDISEYYLQITNDTSLITPVAFDTIAGDAFFYQSATVLDYNTTYWWRMASSKGNVTSPFTAYRSFTTHGAYPKQISPLDGAIRVSIKPSLDWESVLGANRYVLELYQDTILIFRDSLESTVIQLKVDDALDFSTSYNWRMHYIKNDVPSLWSPTFTFTTHGPPPPVPTLVAPASASINAGLRPTLEWTPTATSIDYTIQVSRFMNFADTVYSEVVQNTIYSISSNLDANTVYYWRVAARNDEAISEYSTFWNFTTLATSIQQQSKNDLKLSAYPNPSNGSFNLNFTADGNQTQIEVYDGQGKKVLAQNLTHDAGSQNTNINLSAFPKGIYLVKVNNQGISSQITLLLQ